MKKRLHLSVLFGLICAMLLSMTQFNAACDDLRNNVLRLHIIANSNSSTDQALKLKIRDEILEQTGDIFDNADNLQTAKSKAQERLAQFEKIADSVIKKNGFSYKARASFGKAFFETRHYDTFSLPAGNYESLIITLGEGEGKNWWCVIFPSICVPAASDANLRQSVDEKSAVVAEQSENYIIRFKAVEIYEKIKNWFS